MSLEDEIGSLATTPAAESILTNFPTSLAGKTTHAVQIAHVPMVPAAAPVVTVAMERTIAAMAVSLIAMLPQSVASMLGLQVNGVH